MLLILQDRSNNYVLRAFCSQCSALGQIGNCHKDGSLQQFDLCVFSLIIIQKLSVFTRRPHF